MTHIKYQGICGEKGPIGGTYFRVNRSCRQWYKKDVKETEYTFATESTEMW